MNLHQSLRAFSIRTRMIGAILVVLSLLALVVIPELRISDTVIIDVTKFEKVELFV